MYSKEVNYKDMHAEKMCRISFCTNCYIKYAAHSRLKVLLLNIWLQHVKYINSIKYLSTTDKLRLQDCYTIPLFSGVCI